MINLNVKKHLLTSIMTVSSITVFVQSEVQAQTAEIGQIQPIISFLLNEVEATGSPIPTVPSNCAGDDELAEIDELIANNIRDSRVIGAVQIFNQADVDALEGVIIATATFAFESTDGADLDLSPLNSLVEVRGGNINMRSNTLSSYASFDCLKTITGNLVIENNDNLEMIDAFPRLESVGSNMQINNNGSLTSIPEFPSLLSATFIQISGNNALTGVTGFPLLSDTGFFQIDRNNSIEVISGLNNLVELRQGGIGLFQANPANVIECNGQEGTLLCP